MTIFAGSCLLLLEHFNKLHLYCVEQTNIEACGRQLAIPYTRQSNNYGRARLMALRRNLQVDTLFRPEVIGIIPATGSCVSPGHSTDSRNVF